MELKDYRLHAEEVFEWSKTLFVTTDKKSKEVEEKIDEINGMIVSLKEKFSSESDFGKIMNRFEVSLNFIKKANNAYVNIRLANETKNSNLEELRKENSLKMDKIKFEKESVDIKEPEAGEKRRGRPPFKKVA